MGFNECSGYVALAASALATGWTAARYGLRPQPFYLGVGFAAIGLALSALLVRETRHHASHESALVGTLPPEGVPTPREVFWRTTVLDANLSSVSQAGLVNNLNDGMAWGLFPLVFAAAGMSFAQVGLLAAIYPATWGFGQLITGALGPHGAEAAHRLGHVDPGCWYRRHDAGACVRRVCCWCRVARDWHGDGVSHAARRDRRCRPPVVARIRGRRLSPLA